MSETQISEIKVKLDNLHSLDCDCGGAYRQVTAEIFVDAQASEYKQRCALVHEILGTYFGAVCPPDTISEIAEQIVDGLNEL